MVGTALGAGVSVLVAWKAVRIARDPSTWAVKEEDGSSQSQDAMRYRRALLASNANALLQNAGFVLLTKRLGVAPATAVSVFQILWCNVLGFLVEDVFVSDKGQILRRTRGDREALRNAFRGMTSKRYARHTVLSLVDMCVVSTLMKRTEGLVNAIPRPEWYPATLLEIAHSTVVGSFALFAYGNVVRTQWVFTPEESEAQKRHVKTFDALMSTLSVAIALGNLTQSDAASVSSSQPFLETNKGRVVVAMAVMAVCAALHATGSSQSGGTDRGRAMYLGITALCCATLLFQTKTHRLARAMVAGAMVAPAVLA